jgi:hypothetical protein
MLRLDHFLVVKQLAGLLVKTAGGGDHHQVAIRFPPGIAGGAEQDRQIRQVLANDELAGQAVGPGQLPGVAVEGVKHPIHRDAGPAVEEVGHGFFGDSGGGVDGTVEG